MIDLETEAEILKTSNDALQQLKKWGDVFKEYKDSFAYEDKKKLCEKLETINGLYNIFCKLIKDDTRRKKDNDAFLQDVLISGMELDYDINTMGYALYNAILNSVIISTYQKSQLLNCSSFDKFKDNKSA